MLKKEQEIWQLENEKYWGKQPTMDSKRPNREYTTKISVDYNDPTLGRKFDSGKTDYSLLPLKSLKEVADVLGIGACKYARENWRYVEDRENRYWAAAMRHMISWKEGDKLDDETGKDHLAHALCNIMFLLEVDLENKT
jgi:Domain of unknown function (DUF5664)